MNLEISLILLIDFVNNNNFPRRAAGAPMDNKGFIFSTRILMADNSVKLLGNLVPGDKIKAVNEKLEIVEDEVTSLIKNENVNCSVIGDIICGNNQTFYNPVFLIDIKSKDYRATNNSAILTIIDDKLVKIQKVGSKPNPLLRQVYQLRTKNGFRYFANEILTK